MSLERSLHCDPSFGLRRCLLLEKTHQSSKRVKNEWVMSSFSILYSVWDDTCVFRDKAVIINMYSLYLNIIIFIDSLVRKSITM